MKNLVKLLGIIAFVAVIGFSTVSCHRTVLDVITDDYTTGTVRVYNNSTYSADSSVTFYLCNSSGTVLNTVTRVGYNQSAYWYHVASGSYYMVKSRDTSGYQYSSSTFYLSSGQDKVLYYNGTRIQ